LYRECSKIDLIDAPVAQLDRASAFEAEGREFESLRARQFPQIRRFKARELDADDKRLGRWLAPSIQACENYCVPSLISTRIGDIV
jgi:hypothetical protein